jgi:hypothetical protein
MGRAMTERGFVFFDTSFIGGVLYPMERAHRERLAAYIWHEWRYAISTMTMIELAVGLCRGDDAHWTENRDRFALLQQPDPAARILQLPQEFVAEVLFRSSNADSPFAPRTVRLWFEAIAAGQTRKELVEGVYSPTQDEYVRFDCAVIVGELDRIRARYSEIMTHKRDRLHGKTPMTFVLSDAEWLTEDSNTGIASQRIWTAAILHASGVPVMRESVARAQPMLDAAYRYQRWLDASVGGTYKFENDPSAWADLQQLMYLSDPAVHIVTADRDHVTRTAGTTQARQIIISDDFLARAGL